MNADDWDLRLNDTTGERPPLLAEVGRSLLVEIMGPAAAGKTSLVRTLRARDDRIRAGFAVPRLLWFRFVVGKVATLFPVWILRYRRDRWFTWNEMKSMAFLDAWLRASRRSASTSTLAIVLDHGPVYRLARLREFGPAVTRSARFQRWWRACLDGWLGALDVVVSLDAPDPVLLDRVEERGHWYLSADRPSEEKDEFLARFRRAFAETLQTGTAGRPKLVRVRSDRRTPHEIAEEVLAELGSIADGPPRPEASRR